MSPKTSMLPPTRTSNTSLEATKASTGNTWYRDRPGHDGEAFYRREIKPGLGQGFLHHRYDDFHVSAGCEFRDYPAEGMVNLRGHVPSGDTRRTT